MFSKFFFDKIRDFIGNDPFAFTMRGVSHLQSQV